MLNTKSFSQITCGFNEPPRIFKQKKNQYIINFKKVFNSIKLFFYSNTFYQICYKKKILYSYK